MADDTTAAEKAVQVERNDLARRWFARMKDVLIPLPLLDGETFHRTAKVAELTAPRFADESGVWWNEPGGSTHLTLWADVQEHLAFRRFH